MVDEPIRLPAESTSGVTIKETATVEPSLRRRTVSASSTRLRFSTRERTSSTPFRRSAGTMMSELPPTASGAA